VRAKPVSKTMSVEFGQSTQFQARLERVYTQSITENTVVVQRTFVLIAYRKPTSRQVTRTRTDAPIVCARNTLVPAVVTRLRTHVCSAQPMRKSKHVSTMQMAARPCAHHIQNCKALLKFETLASPAHPTQRSQPHLQMNLETLFRIALFTLGNKGAMQYRTLAKMARWNANWMLGFRTSLGALMFCVVSTLACVAATRLGTHVRSAQPVQKSKHASKMQKAVEPCVPHIRKAKGRFKCDSLALLVRPTPNCKLISKMQTVLKGNSVQIIVSSKV